MLPQNVTTPAVTASAFTAPRDRVYDPMVSYHEGGNTLYAAAPSRRLKVWKADYAAGFIRVTPEDESLPPNNVVAVANVTSISLAFDANMFPVLAYCENGTFKLRWYNAAASDISITELVGVTAAQIAVDDLRPELIGRDDIILAYTKGGNLYWAMQRDRYTVEHLIGPVSGRVLQRVGMTAGMRLQFELVDPAA